MRKGCAFLDYYSVDYDICDLRRLMILKKESVAAIAALFAICSCASAATLVDFKPVPISPTTPEFQFSRALGGGVPVFRADVGATSNNDGNLPVQNQTAPGLDSE